MINVGDSIKMKQSSLARKQIKNIFFKALPKRETCRKIQNKSHREMCCLPRHTTDFKCTTIHGILGYIEIVLIIVYIEILFILCLPYSCQFSFTCLESDEVKVEKYDSFAGDFIFLLGIR